MSSKSRIIFAGVFLIILVFTAILLLIVPKVEIDLNGNKVVILNAGEEYVEEGATAYINSFGKKEVLDVSISGSVDNAKIGRYVLTYNIIYNNHEYNKIRIINIVDKEKPLLTLNKEPLICKNNNLIEVDATAIDNLDGDISSKIKYNVSNNKITISVSDSYNNKAEIIKDVKYNDSEKPVIKLNGNQTINLALGEKYIEEGATAYDSCDGNISNKIVISGSVDSTIVGNYEIMYSVKDSYNNEVKTVRNVNVIKDTPQVTSATIYLTFDDGPGPYTEEILQILNKYNIKATFFVTNQLPKYQNIIKKEYENGHTIAAHTYSHKWSIYDSVNIYLNDFNNIQNIIIEQTGSPTKYFRFPGGSSNTVSRSHCKGIMTKLAEIMQNDGYVYFDWSIDSGDTHKNNTKEYIVNMVKSHLKGNGNYMILMHDIKKNTLLALPTIIEYGLKNGYTFKAIDDTTPTFHFKIAN